MGALIEIKELHIHVDLSQISKDAKKILQELTKIQTDMAETKAELLALITQSATSLSSIGTSIDNVSTDVTELLQKITDGTTPEGGLIAADTAELKTALQGIVDSTATAATNIQTVADKYKNAGEPTV